jgi:uncharacterized DUF497 family protein
MASIRFVWDPHKDRLNQRKHGVAFAEAKTVFFDETALLIDDPDHSDDEDRFILLGLSSSLRLLIVCHCYREDDEVIRIFSARKATSHEAKSYSR